MSILNTYDEISIIVKHLSTFFYNILLTLFSEQGMMMGGESSSYPNPYGRYMMMCPIKPNSGREQQKKSKEDIKPFTKEKIQVRLDIYNTNVS